MDNTNIIDNGLIKDHGYLKSKDISKDDYFMDIARVVGEKCTCNRGKCGCVIVKDDAIISTGFANAPKGSKTCDEIGHEIITIIKNNGEKEEHCMRNNCAEQNAIANAAKLGVSLEGASIYVTMTPCTIRHCAHMIVNCGIKNVICDKRGQHPDEAESIFKHAGVNIKYLSNEVEVYPKE